MSKLLLYLYESKEKREKERAAWRELKIVIRNYRALGDWNAK